MMGEGVISVTESTTLKDVTGRGGSLGCIHGGTPQIIFPKITGSPFGVGDRN
jgi:hypothetical protein